MNINFSPFSIDDESEGQVAWRKAPVSSTTSVKEKKQVIDYQGLKVTPDVWIYKIFSSLTFKEILTFGQTCKKNNELVKNNRIWEPYYRMNIQYTPTSLSLIMGLSIDDLYTEGLTDDLYSGFIDLEKKEFFGKDETFLERIKKVIQIIRIESSNPFESKELFRSLYRIEPEEKFKEDLCKTKPKHGQMLVKYEELLKHEKTFKNTFPHYEFQHPYEPYYKLFINFLDPNKEHKGGDVLEKITNSMYLAFAEN